MHGGCTDIIWKDEDTSGKEESSNMDCTLRLPATPDSTLLKNSTYEQLLTEIARRNLDVEDEAIFELLKKTYNIQKQIGKGSSGVVHQVYHKDLNKRFACKVIEKSGPINDFQSMKTEIEIMRRVTHPRIISLHELYESPKCMWLILELVDAGGLRSKLSSMKRKFPEHLTVKFTKQILEGLHYLHNQGIIHRDIKIDNILFEGNTQTGSVKIADFGLSALMESGENGYSEDPVERKKYRGLKSAWGTPTHYSPELIGGAYGPQTDMWSLGCVVYEMLTGFNAFPPSTNRTDQHRHKDLFRRIRSSNYRRSNLIHVSSSCRDFISKLLELDPEVRMSPEEALHHPWIASGCPLSETESMVLKQRTRRINPLKLLSCIRHRQEAPNFPQSPTGNHYCVDSPGKENQYVSSRTDVTSQRKRSMDADANASNCTLVVKSNETHTTNTSGSTSKESTPDKSALFPIRGNTNTFPSPTNPKSRGQGLGFFTVLYTAVTRKEN